MNSHRKKPLRRNTATNNDVQYPNGILRADIGLVTLRTLMLVEVEPGDLTIVSVLFLYWR